MTTEHKDTQREMVISYAMKSFAAKGIKAVKMDDIAHELSISKRTLYELFENKETLLYEGVKRYHERNKRNRKELIASSDNVMTIILKTYRAKLDQFRKVSPAFYSDIIKYPVVVEYLARQNHESQQIFMDFLQRGVKEGFFRDDINYELVSMSFFAINRYVIDNKMYGRYTVEDLFNNMLFVIVRGFCTKKGIDALDTFLLTSEISGGQTDASTLP